MDPPTAWRSRGVTSSILSTPDREYQRFPDVARRNFMQETFEVPLLVHLLRLPAGGRVLEVGCGQGIALPPLAAALRPRQLVGLDVDGTLIEAAGSRLREKGVNAELHHADVRAIPFPDESFDLVIDFGTCYHIGAPERALREIVRVLGPGGLFVYETPASQLLSHPVRTRGKRLPWRAAPELRVVRRALLWKARRKEAA
jgi:ubiquinone/menaquinone biosynthesis C-methylase UbiE